MNLRKQDLRGQRIGILGRGGCGKSTVTVFLARALVAAGYRVCVLDADSNTEGLAHALGASHAPKALLEWLGDETVENGLAACPREDLRRLPGAQVRLRELPDRFYSRTPDGSLIFQVGKIGLLNGRTGRIGPMARITRDFTLESESPEPVMLLDFKAGIEEVCRGVVASLDWVVGVIDPSWPGVQAVETLQTLLGRLQAAPEEPASMPNDNGLMARTKGAVYALNKVSDTDTEYQLWQLLIQAGIHPVAAFADEPQVRREWLENLPLSSASALAEAAKIVRSLEEGRGRFTETEPRRTATTL